MAISFGFDEIFKYRSPQPDQRVCWASPDGVCIDYELDILVGRELRRGESDKVCNEDRGEKSV